MINLLPLKEKKKIYQLYFIRLSIVSLFLLLIVLIVGTVLLLPSLFLSVVKERSAAERVLLAREALSLEEGRNVEAIIASVNKKIGILALAPGVSATLNKAFRTIIDRQPEGLKITGLLYEKDVLGDTGRGKIFIRGISSERDALIAFADLLKKESLFSEVDLPVSNLIKSEDIAFSITVFLNEN